MAIEVYRLQCNGLELRCCVAECSDGSIAGCIDVPTPSGVIRLAAKVPREVILAGLQRAQPWLAANAAAAGVEIVGRRRLFKGKLIGKLGRLGKKILESKVVRGAMKVARFVPGYGQAINAAYKTARKASNVAAQLGRGRGSSRQAVRQLRQIAERRLLPNGAAASGEQVRVSQDALARIRQAYLNRYGSRIARALQNGGAVSGSEQYIITGAAELGLLDRFKAWAFRRGMPELPSGGARGLYREGLRALS